MKFRLLALLVVLLSSGLAFGYTVKIDGTDYVFRYKRTVTIQGSQVQGGPHNSFPMLFDSTKVDSGLRDDLRTVGNGGKVRSPDGYDIVFAEGDGQEIFKHEIEKYVATSGDYIAWVKVDLTGSDQIIYLYYGRDDPNPDTQHVTDVWDTNFKMVQHMADATSSTIEGSTSSGITGTKGWSNNPDEVDGKIGMVQDFDGGTEYMTFEDHSIWNWTPVDEDRTFSFWFYPTINLSNDQDVFQFLTGVSTFGNHYQFTAANDAGSVGFAVIIWDNGWTTPIGYYGVYWWPPLLNTWYYITFVASTAGNNEFYVNGVSQSIDVELSWDDNTRIYPSAIEVKSVAGNSTGRGRLDEYRFSHSALSAGWIKTEHNNQNAPASFYSISGPTLVELTYFMAKGLNSAVLLEWATETELDNEGFNIWRSEKKDRKYVQINPYFIPAEGEAGFGAEYSYTDYDVENGVTYYYLLVDVDFHGKSTFHGPVSATPNDFIIIWPIDWEPLPSGYSLFSWTSSGNFSFKVDVSTNPSFPDSKTLSFPEEGWTSGHSLWLRPEEWEVILRKARAAGGQLFWRVRAKSQDGRTIYSDWRRFVIEKHRLPEE